MIFFCNKKCLFLGKKSSFSVLFFPQTNTLSAFLRLMLQKSLEPGHPEARRGRPALCNIFEKRQQQWQAPLTSHVCFWSTTAKQQVDTSSSNECGVCVCVYFCPEMQIIKYYIIFMFAETSRRVLRADVSCKTFSGHAGPACHSCDWWNSLIVNIKSGGHFSRN